MKIFLFIVLLNLKLKKDQNLIKLFEILSQSKHFIESVFWKRITVTAIMQSHGMAQNSI